MFSWALIVQTSKRVRTSPCCTTRSLPVTPSWRWDDWDRQKIIMCDIYTENSCWDGVLWIFESDSSFLWRSRDAFCFPVTSSELSSHRSVSRRTRLHCAAVQRRDRCTWETPSCHSAPLLQFSAHKLKVIKALYVTVCSLKAARLLWLLVALHHSGFFSVLGAQLSF